MTPVWMGPLVVGGQRYDVRRAWPRSVGHVLLEAQSPDGPVAGQWFADPADLARVAGATPPPAVADLATGLLMQPGGADRRLRELRPLLAEPGARLVRHRPEQRAVVARDGSAGPRTYAKVLRRGRAEAVAAAHRRAAEVAGDAFTVPAVTACDADAGLVETAAVGGRMLLDLDADTAVPDRRVAAAWRATGAALRRLHDGTWTDGPEHTVADECGLVERRLEMAAGLGLLPPIDPAPLLEPLRVGPPGPVGLLHRDLHDQQVLVAGDAGDADCRVALIDLDTLARGERALDVANVLVHLELRVLQGALSAQRSALAGEEFLAGLAADPGTLRRVPAYAAATRLRLATVYAFRPGQRRVAMELLGAACRRGAA